MLSRKDFIPGPFLQPVNVALTLSVTPVLSGLECRCTQCPFQPVMGSPHLDPLVWSFSKLEEMNPVFNFVMQNTFFTTRTKNGWYPSLLSLAMIMTMTKSNLGEKEVYSGSFRKVRAGTEAETGKESSLLLSLAHSPYLILPKTTCLGVSSAHSGLGPPMTIINQENALQTCLQASLMEALNSSLFPGDLSCVLLTEN